METVLVLRTDWGDAAPSADLAEAWSKAPLTKAGWPDMRFRGARELISRMHGEMAEASRHLAEQQLAEALPALREIAAQSR